MHPLGDEMAAALEDHASVGREMQTNVRAIELLLDDQRRVGQEPI
jgi:hypothetical protein